MNNIVVDKNFLSMAITVVLQMRGELSDTEYVTVMGWEIDDENETLELNVDLKMETSN